MIDWINSIFEQTKKSNDNNKLYISIFSVWFDNFSYFLDENLQFVILPVIIYISHYIGICFLMTDQYKLYLIQFQQLQGSPSILTPK